MRTEGRASGAHQRSGRSFAGWMSTVLLVSLIALLAGIALGGILSA